MLPARPPLGPPVPASGTLLQCLFLTSGMNALCWQSHLPWPDGGGSHRFLKIYSKPMLC